MIPYLHFRGQAAEALAFYAEAFGTAEPQITFYPDSGTQVMHGQISTPVGMLMASDFAPGVAGEAQRAVSVMYTLPEVDRARAVFDLLAEAGEVIEGFAATAFTPGMGRVRDRFGTHWIIAAAPGRD